MNRSLLMKLGLALCLAASLSGCPKQPVTTVAGSDDERLDSYSARLEELRSRANAGEVQCPEWCTAAKEVCAISTDVCDISSRLPDRSEVAQRCVSSQEDCARFNDECGRCG